MRKRLMILLLTGILALTMGACQKEAEETVSSSEAEKLTLEINCSGKSLYADKLETTDESLPEESTSKVETGIKNWLQVTLGADDSLSAESKILIDEKFYEIIVSEEQKEAVRKEREAFYKEAKITTESIDVDVKNASVAKYNSKSIGVVECTATIKGIRNENEFEKHYDLTLLMDYQQNIASVYEVDNIQLK